MDIYDILACPTCKVAVIRHETSVVCSQCQRHYPIVNNVPVMFPDSSVPHIQHEAELSIRTSYNPWIERVVMQSLPPNALVLDLGAGNMACNLPHVIRMDVTLTPYVDVVGDAHALPFLPGTFDFIFSLAVIEHLRQPFIAAQEMYQVARHGGYVYGECNFVYPYHGYPHHYFGTTQQGIEEVFRPFMNLRSGVATYQMPSFAVRFVLESYNYYLGNEGQPDVTKLQNLIQQILNLPLSTYDQRFNEESANRVAAGVFFFGVKSEDGTSEVIPSIVHQLWHQDQSLQQRFPRFLDLGRADNIMVWAKQEGRKIHPDLDAYFASHTYFRKDAHVDDSDLRDFLDLPIIEPAFGYIEDAERAFIQEDATTNHVDVENIQRIHELEAIIEQKNRHIFDLERYIYRLEIEQKNRHILDLERHIARLESGRVMRLLRLLQK